MNTKVPTIEDRLNAARQTLALIGTLLHGLEHVEAGDGNHLKSEGLSHATDLCTAAHTDVVAVLRAVSQHGRAPAPDGKEGGAI